MWRWWVSAVVGAALVTACDAPTATVVNTPAPTPSAMPTRSRALGVAVAARSPTPTPALVGDYASLVRPRLELLQQGFRRLEQQLAILQKAPIRMAEDDWRDQLRTILDDLSAGSAGLRSLGTQVEARVALAGDVLRLADDVDFVADEYRMALDFDPDSTHFVRAGRAEKTTADKLDSLLTDLRRRASPSANDLTQGGGAGILRQGPAEPGD